MLLPAALPLSEVVGSRAARGRACDVATARCGSKQSRVHHYDETVTRLVAIGLVAGVFSSLFGVGGGILIVPLLMLVAAFPPRPAVATSLGAIAITALAGAALYALRGEVRVWYALLVGGPAVIGALAGASLQQRLSGRGLTLGFAALLVAIGVWMIVA